MRVPAAKHPKQNQHATKPDPVNFVAAARGESSPHPLRGHPSRPVYRR